MCIVLCKVYMCPHWVHCTHACITCITTLVCVCIPCYWVCTRACVLVGMLVRGCINMNKAWLIVCWSNHTLNSYKGYPDLKDLDRWDYRDLWGQPPWSLYLLWCMSYSSLEFTTRVVTCSRHNKFHVHTCGCYRMQLQAQCRIPYVLTYPLVPSYAHVLECPWVHL